MSEVILIHWNTCYFKLLFRIDQLHYRIVLFKVDQETPDYRVWVESLDRGPVEVALLQPYHNGGAFEKLLNTVRTPRYTLNFANKNQLSQWLHKLQERDYLTLGVVQFVMRRLPICSLSAPDDTYPSIVGNSHLKPLDLLLFQLLKKSKDLKDNSQEIAPLFDEYLKTVSGLICSYIKGHYFAYRDPDFYTDSPALVDHNPELVHYGFLILLYALRGLIYVTNLDDSLTIFQSNHPSLTSACFSGEIVLDDRNATKILEVCKEALHQNNLFMVKWLIGILNNRQSRGREYLSKASASQELQFEILSLLLTSNLPNTNYLLLKNFFNSFILPREKLLSLKKIAKTTACFNLLHEMIDRSPQKIDPRNPHLFIHSSTKIFIAACRKIESHPNYQPYLTDEELLNLVVDINGKPIYNLEKVALAIQRSPINIVSQAVKGVLYQIKRARFGNSEYEEDLPPRWSIDNSVVLFVSTKCSYSFYTRRDAVQGKFTVPLNHLTIEQILSYECLHYPKESRNEVFNFPNRIINAS